MTTNALTIDTVTVNELIELYTKRRNFLMEMQVQSGTGPQWHLCEAKIGVYKQVLEDLEQLKVGLSEEERKDDECYF